MKKFVFSNSVLTVLGFVVATAFFGEASRADETPRPAALSSNGAASLPSGGATGFSVGKIDPLRRNSSGIQTLYPAVAKIVGRGVAEEKEDGAQAIPLYYGSGSYVAENGEFGLVLTNWHVVSESNESIEVLFPNFSSPAKIVLRDEIWDLAALIVRKPPNLVPVPIALEVPKIGETLWVAGYGQSGGLADFQIQSGLLLNYVELFEPQDLPIETLAVGRGVRQGDSGGPIFNRYGEIAGILWGSDGKVTMGTFCVRAQVFLTQAFQRLTVIYAENSLDAPNSDAATDFLSWNKESFNAEAVESETSSEVLVKKNGVFPISPNDVYVSADERADADALQKAKRGDALQFVEQAALNLGKNATVELPPSPPIFSPTFVVQQRKTNRTRPEVAESGFYERWNESALADAANARVLNLHEADDATPILTAARESDSVVRFQNAASGFDTNENATLAANEGANPPPTLESAFDALIGNALSEPRLPGAQRLVAPSETASNAASASTKNDSSKERAPQKKNRGANAKGFELKNSGADFEQETNEKNQNPVEKAEETTSENDDERSENVLELRPLNWNALSGWQIYVVICGMFCLFYNAGRLLAPPQKRRKNVPDAAVNRSNATTEPVRTSVEPPTKSPTDV